MQRVATVSRLPGAHVARCKLEFLFLDIEPVRLVVSSCAWRTVYSRWAMTNRPPASLRPALRVCLELEGVVASGSKVVLE